MNEKSRRVATEDERGWKRLDVREWMKMMAMTTTTT